MHTTASPVVTTLAGPVRGALTSGGGAVCRGIPYAAPTGGPRRWQPAAPVPPWADVRDATAFGPTAPQHPSALESMWGAQELRTGEDCLVLNVWTPCADAAGRPVLVWVHGGGFTGGSGSTPWYDGRRLCARGEVVVVTFNYRLGALGFLDLSSRGLRHAANCGLLDQVEALRWVRDNITAFGGDPGNVTVFGESAGAMSIGALLATPAASGLFHKAVLQSGAARHASSAERAAQVAEEVLDAAGLEGADVERLQAVDVDVVLAAQAVVERRHAGPDLAFQPVIDGTDLPQAPLAAIAAGSARAVPLMVGTNAEEMKLFGVWEKDLSKLDDASLVERWGHNLGAQAPAIVATYRSSRPGASAAELWSAIGTDAIFRVPAIRLLEAQLGHQPSCFAYVFTMASTAFGGALGACHAQEIPYVFDTLDRPGVSLFTGDPPGAAGLAVAMQHAWVAFARSGDPSSDGAICWPRYDTTLRSTMELGHERRVLLDPASAERELWEGLG